MTQQISHRITGPGAASLKYDLLTALLVMAAKGAPVPARLALRLSLLITARFNWRQGTFSVGQREMARMWGVSERTAKREIAELRRLNWIDIRIPAARGRVASYQIEFDRILNDTQPHWPDIGPDYVARMSQTPEEDTKTGNVIPLHSKAATTFDETTLWGRVGQRLSTTHPTIYQAWLVPVQSLEVESGILTLLAPSKFHADYIRTHLRTKILAAIPLAEGVRDIAVTS